MKEVLHQESVAARLTLGDLRMAKMEQDIGEIKTALAQNTALTQSVKDIVETWNTMSRVWAGIGTLARWVAGVGAAAFALWQLATKWKGGH